MALPILLVYSTQERTKLRGIPVYKFRALEKYFWGNFTESLGFCSENIANVDFDACAKATPDPEVLDLSGCGLNEMGRPLCLDGKNVFEVVIRTVHKGHILHYVGARNLDTCYGAPVWLSLPYFLNGNDLLKEDVIFAGGKKAARGLHETSIYVEPNTGSAVKADKRLQMNIPLQPADDVDTLRNVRFALHPILWMEETAELDEATAHKVRLMMVVPLAFLAALQWTLVAAGVALAAATLIYGANRRMCFY